jgi:Rad3-related DNA helicase
MLDNELLKESFPFSTPRPGQAAAIRTIIRSFIEGNKIFILEAPTGIGKSAIAYTVGRYMLKKFPIEDDPLDKKNKYGETYPKCIILTNTKSLQQQYIDTFKTRNLESIWSSESFDCADEGMVGEVTYGKPGCRKTECKILSLCGYYQQKQKFLKSEIGVCNYSYFLTYCTLKTRYLILDEAHNLEDVLCNAAEIKTNDYFFWLIKKTVTNIHGDYKYTECMQLLKKFVKIKFPSKVDMKEFFTNIIPLLAPAKILIDKEIEKLEVDLRKNSEDQKVIKKLTPLVKTSSMMDDYFERVKNFCTFMTDWVCNEIVDNKESTSFNIKPMFVSEYFELLKEKCEYILMMSATICGVQQFAKEIGLSDFKYLYSNSIIPAKNRPVYKHLIGHINFKNKDELLPKFVTYMDKLIDDITKNWELPQNGIIHTISKANATFIYENSKYKKNMIIPTKDQLLNLESLYKNENKILVAYNMLEGVDLRDEMSRFQIFPKLPYGNLGDAWIESKMKWDEFWYARDCIIKLVQGSGRSIRSEEDWALTFILDSNFDRLLNHKKDLFPQWYLDAIVKLD